jgi:hypothetical protein
MEFYLQFVFGFVGGVSPEVVRIYKNVIAGNLDKYKHLKAYITISVILAIVGGILAIAMESTSYFNAMVHLLH